MTAIQTIHNSDVPLTQNGGSIQTKVTVVPTSCCPTMCQLSSCCLPTIDLSKRKVVSRSSNVLSDESIDSSFSTFWKCCSSGERQAEIWGIQLFQKFLSEEYGEIAGKAAPFCTFERLGTMNVPLNLQTLITSGSPLRVDQAIAIERKAKELAKRELEIAKAAKLIKYYLLSHEYRSENLRRLVQQLAKESLREDELETVVGSILSDISNRENRYVSDHELRMMVLEKLKSCNISIDEGRLRDRGDEKGNGVIEISAAEETPRLQVFSSDPVDHDYPVKGMIGADSVRSSFALDPKKLYKINDDGSIHSLTRPLREKISTIVRKLTTLTTIDEHTFKAVVADISSEISNTNQWQISNTKLIEIIFNQLKSHKFTFDDLIGGELPIVNPLTSAQQLIFMQAFVRELLLVDQLNRNKIDKIIVRILDSMHIVFTQPRFLEAEQAKLSKEENTQLVDIVLKLRNEPVSDLRGNEIALLYKVIKTGTRQDIFQNAIACTWR